MPIVHSGRLAIWHDCARRYEADFEAWYQTEHLDERLSVPGFQRGRRYEALAPGGGYFTYYETESPDVLMSPAYIERVNNPTPMTAHVMRNAFTNMSRTICEARYSIGKMKGAFATTLLLSDLPEQDQLAAWAEDQARVSLIARVEAWRAVDVSQPQSTEEALRGGDSRIHACLLVETLREEGCRLVEEQLAKDLGVPLGGAASFRLLCELSNG